MFILIAFVSLSIILRFEYDSTKGFSLLTTFIAGIFVPCAVSKEPQNSQYKETEPNHDSDISKVRRNLTAKIAMGSVTIVMLFNIMLLILLTYTM